MLTDNATADCEIYPELIKKSPDSLERAYGDGAYDTNRLYDLAATRHVKLVAPQRIRNASGLAHRRHSPRRIEMFSRLSSDFVRGLLRSRVGIEHMFGHLTNIGCGLKPLPSWVRGKMIFYHIWRQEITPGYV